MLFDDDAQARYASIVVNHVPHVLTSSVWSRVSFLACGICTCAMALSQRERTHIGLPVVFDVEF